MKLYFDSSGLVKLLIDEPGGEWARELWTGVGEKYSSSIAYGEVRAGLAAAKRDNRLNDAQFAEAKAQFELLWPALASVEPEDVLIRQAGDLAETHALRGFDAVHLATALALSDDETELCMASWDERLATAACDAGISVLRTTHG
jgi:uncharacterized protein